MTDLLKCSKIIFIVSILFFAACESRSGEETPIVSDDDAFNISEEADDDTESESTGDQEETVTDENETSTDEDETLTDDEVSDSDMTETDDPDGETSDTDPEELQTGGIYIFSGFDESGNAESREILGNGGFFGFSIMTLSEKYWAVSAIHESIPAFDWDKATGKLYIFEKEKKIEKLEDAAFVLNHPDRPFNVGFGYAAAELCDINGDGLDDLAVSSHLATFNDLGAAGEIVVFYGSPDGWSEENASISRLSSTYIQKADSMSQSLACLDYDEDGFADIFAGGQNAGPELSGGGSQGMVAMFKGSPEGLSEYEKFVLLPEVAEKAQYFGSGMLTHDFNGDGLTDLVVAGWGLKENGSVSNSGGIYIYLGGSNWQTGASKKIFGEADSQFGSGLKIIEIGGKKYLAVLATKDKNYGTANFYDPAEDFAARGRFSFPSAFEENGNISDFDTIKLSADTDLIIVGGKNFGNGGMTYCATINNKTISEPEACKFQPESPAGGYGYSVKNIGNGEIVVGKPEYIHKF